MGFAHSELKQDHLALKVRLQTAANLKCASAHDEPIEIGANP